MVSKVSGKVSGGYKNNKTLEIKRIEGKKAIIVTPDSTNRAGLKLANKEHPRYLSVWVQHPKEDYDDGEFADRIWTRYEEMCMGNEQENPKYYWGTKGLLSWWWREIAWEIESKI